MTDLRLSYSQASTWDECPAKWAAHYIDGVKTPETVEMAVGTATHEALEVLYGGGTRADAERVIVASDLSASAQAKAMVHLEAASLMEDLEGVEVIGVEFKLDVVLAGVRFVGVIDRVDRVGGAVRLVDYKTGNRPVDRFMAPKRRQLWLYAAAWRTLEPGPLSTRFVWTKTGLVDDVPCTRSSVEASVRWLGEVAVQIGEATDTGEYEAKAGPLCGWCPAVSSCPAGQVAVKRRRSEGRSIGPPAMEWLGE